ncbi:DUF1624 domain-containing protein [Leucobacter sp. CSA2]|uniref:DUF1624 domain-containing protein n=1 Tax=Leucobacter edaphi TaxID=2796472 RepID=A0A934QCU5_9MICO|nr:heparan-alpha-glucosaminide N-acetyltransferase domain-containing protein [Leucobacter edaphi]MBK0422280.1 DUF1624 domain-containing protein [Leucobacter edaphi]
MTASIPTAAPPVSAPSPRTASAADTVPDRASASRDAALDGSGARLVGVDIARLLAIVGMMATHLIATTTAVSASGPVGAVAAEVVNLTAVGIAAPLFAVLGGVSSALASRRLLEQGRVGAAIAAIAIRGSVVFFIGLLLGMLASPVAVVLCFFGVAMMLVAPLIAVRGPLLALIAVVVGAASGPVNAFVRQSIGEVTEGGSPTFETLFTAPIESLRALFVTGIYPALTWFVYLTAGILLARALIAAMRRGTLGRVAALFAGGGIAVAIAGQAVSEWAISHVALLGSSLPDHVDQALIRVLLESPGYGAPAGTGLWAQLVATPHSGSGMDLVRTIAISFAVICVLVLAFDARGKRPGLITDVFRAAGAAPLTIYVLHIVLVALTLGVAESDPQAFGGSLPWWTIGVGGLAVQFAGVLLIGFVLSRTGRSGPLETLISRGVTNTIAITTRARTRM